MYLSTSNDKCSCKAVHNLSIYKHKFSINNQLKLIVDKIYDKIVKIGVGKNRKKSMNLLNLKRTTTLIRSNKTKRNLQQKEKKNFFLKHTSLSWKLTMEKHFMLRFMRVVSLPWEAIMSREIVLYWREFRSFRPCKAELSPLKFSCSLAISFCSMEISPIRS